MACEVLKAQILRNAILSTSEQCLKEGKVIVVSGQMSVLGGAVYAVTGGKLFIIINAKLFIFVVLYFRVQVRLIWTRLRAVRLIASLWEVLTGRRAIVVGSN